jgi:hypothetical protein
MDKTITTAMLIVISMITALLLFNIAYPAILQGGDAMTSMAYGITDRMKSQVSIIHASSELPSGDWQITNTVGEFDVSVWVKNTGSSRVAAIERLDVFFGPEGNFARVPHQSQAGGSFPYWTATVTSGSDWDPTGTLLVSIHYSSALANGRYFVKVTLPTGVSSDYYLGI